jgi:hypothetical protein
MLSNNIKDIKEDLARTNRAIVALGCSFVQGAELGLENLTAESQFEYKTKNAFIHRLCEIYFSSSYTPINFGQEGSGNYAAISRLFLYDIPWKQLDEIVVIFMPTGMQRFDIIKDENSASVGREFKTLWPFVPYPAKLPPGLEHLKNFTTGYQQTAYSEKFEVLNCILHFQILNSWINEHSAKLIVFPAFNKEYNREYFLKNLRTDLYRDERTYLQKPNGVNTHSFDYDFLVNTVPWEKFVSINGSSNFFDLCFRNDPNYQEQYSMQEVLNKNLMHDNKWIKPRGHPSELGHDLLARELYKILVDL